MSVAQDEAEVVQDAQVALAPGVNVRVSCPTGAPEATTTGEVMVDESDPGMAAIMIVVGVPVAATAATGGTIAVISASAVPWALVVRVDQIVAHGVKAASGSVHRSAAAGNTLAGARLCLPPPNTKD